MGFPLKGERARRQAVRDLMCPECGAELEYGSCPDCGEMLAPATLGGCRKCGCDFGPIVEADIAYYTSRPHFTLGRCPYTDNPRFPATRGHC